jgi:hypothetical protein
LFFLDSNLETMLIDHTKSVTEVSATRLSFHKSQATKACCRRNAMDLRGFFCGREVKYEAFLYFRDRQIVESLSWKISMSNQYIRA